MRSGRRQEKQFPLLFSWAKDRHKWYQDLLCFILPFFFLRWPETKNPAAKYRQAGSKPGNLATLFNVGCKQPQICPRFKNLQSALQNQAAVLSWNKKTSRSGEASIRLPYRPHGPLRAGFGTLRCRLPGGSQGQFPTATLHDISSEILKSIYCRIFKKSRKKLREWFRFPDEMIFSTFYFICFYPKYSTPYSFGGEKDLFRDYEGFAVLQDYHLVLNP